MKYIAIINPNSKDIKAFARYSDVEGKKGGDKIDYLLDGILYEGILSFDKKWSSDRYSQLDIVEIPDSLKKANKKYEDKRKSKRVSFNLETETDLLDFAESVDFSSWVKELIKKELNK
ncbi:hypothetical protein [Acinetobacter radioresistens]|uniref:hypothetical protein n=1 Tax=Acinetobacter radioresistens TaxID=40216 RepID=UPI000C33A4E7|nr:hypothetical protein [Acinetobacter radioresistens]PKH29163.1 hypothetical protein BJF94_12015 [Acinetobacter radioresistens]